MGLRDVFCHEPSCKTLAITIYTLTSLPWKDIMTQQTIIETLAQTRYRFVQLHADYDGCHQRYHTLRLDVLQSPQDHALGDVVFPAREGLQMYPAVDCGLQWPYYRKC